MSGRAKDLTGNRYGRLTVIERRGSKKNRAQWLCKCDCGKTKVISSYHLTSGNTRSCGCLEYENRISHITKHGLGKHPLYTVWKNMKARCFNVKNKSYHNYGGRGISVCDNWIKDFKWFYDDCIVAGWREGLQIDRKDNEGNYESGNIRFVTKQKNMQNTRVSKLNADKVREIRDLLYIGHKDSVIAARFDVCSDRIRQIRLGTAWANV